MPLPLAALSSPDIIVLAVCGVLAVRGAFKGFTWQLVRTIGLIAVVWSAFWLHEPVGAWLGERVSPLHDSWNEVAAWILIVIAGWLIVTFIAHMARGAVRTVDLTGTDRILGFAMGAVMGLAFTTFGFAIYGRFADEEQLTHTLEDSHAAHFMGRFIQVAQPIFPSAIRDKWCDTLDAIQEAGGTLDDGDDAESDDD